MRLGLVLGWRLGNEAGARIKTWERDYHNSFHALTGTAKYLNLIYQKTNQSSESDQIYTHFVGCPLSPLGIHHCHAPLPPQLHLLYGSVEVDLRPLGQPREDRQETAGGGGESKLVCT